MTGAVVILLEAGALILTLAAFGFFLLMDRPEDLGRVTDGWLRRNRGDRP